MAKIILHKRRRFRTDPSNPYRTREMIYTLAENNAKLYLEVEQYDYVLRSQVAEQRAVIPEPVSHVTARQLVEYMLKRAKGTEEVIAIWEDWKKGSLPLIGDTKNVLVQEAIRKRFARNLKKL